MEMEDLGTCCACGKPGATARNLIMLDLRAPVPGTGWGCMVCGLSLDGAVAVVCDDCMAAGAEIREVIAGPAWEKKRAAVQDCGGVFEHDRRKHPEMNYN